MSNKSNCAKVSSKQAQLVPASKLTDADVLLGRGRAIHIHTGNLRFRELVFEHSEAYRVSEDDKAFRRETALKIIRTVRSEGGRFLRKVVRKAPTKRRSCKMPVYPSTCSGEWIVVDLPTAITKVKQALRDAGCVDSPSSSPSKRRSPKDAFPASSARTDILCPDIQMEEAATGPARKQCKDHHGGSITEGTSKTLKQSRNHTMLLRGEHKQEHDSSRVAHHHSPLQLSQSGFECRAAFPTRGRSQREQFDLDALLPPASPIAGSSRIAHHDCLLQPSQGGFACHTSYPTRGTIQREQFDLDALLPAAGPNAIAGHSVMTNAPSGYSVGNNGLETQLGHHHGRLPHSAHHRSLAAGRVTDRWDVTNRSCNPDISERELLLRLERQPLRATIDTVADTLAPVEQRMGRLKRMADLEQQVRAAQLRPTSLADLFPSGPPSRPDYMSLTGHLAAIRSNRADPTFLARLAEDRARLAAALYPPPNRAAGILQQAYPLSLPFPSSGHRLLLDHVGGFNARNSTPESLSQRNELLQNHRRSRPQEAPPSTTTDELLPALLHRDDVRLGRGRTVEAQRMAKRVRAQVPTRRRSSSSEEEATA